MNREQPDKISQAGSKVKVEKGQLAKGDNCCGSSVFASFCPEMRGDIPNAKSEERKRESLLPGFEDLMDYQGQRLAELLYYWIIVLFGVPRGPPANLTSAPPVFLP